MRTRVSWVGMMVVAGLMGVVSMGVGVRAQEKTQTKPPAMPRDVPLDNRAVQTGPLRVAIAGMVHGHVDGFLSGAVKRTDVVIVGIAEPDRALFDQYAKKDGLDAKLYHADLKELLESTHPQAVLVYTSTFGHRKAVETCAEYSLALLRTKTGGYSTKPLTVMMEKPLAVSAEDAHAIAKVAAEAKMPVMVNYFTTWVPSRHGAYELVRSGQIGDVRKMVAHDGHGGPKEIGVGPEFLGWLTDPKLNGGGALYDFGCYGLDFMTWVMGGERPLTVTAVTQQIKPEVYPKVDDEATIVVTYPKAQGIVQASWNWPFGMDDVEVYGKTGEVKTLGRDTMEVRKAGDEEAQKVTAKALMPPMDDELKYLRAVAMGEVKPEGPGTLEINVVVAEILDAARESARTGKTVKIEEKK